jgi:hypothetical protein
LGQWQGWWIFSAWQHSLHICCGDGMPESRSSDQFVDVANTLFDLGFDWALVPIYDIVQVSFIRFFCVFAIYKIINYFLAVTSGHIYQLVPCSLVWTQ